MSNALGAFLFFLVAPGTVLVLLPFGLGLWRVGDPFLGSEATRVVGAALAIAGVTLLVENFVRFVREGRGTPNPLQAPERLVVRGPYRWVRNPMYVALVVTLIGEALAFANTWLFAYAAAAWLLFHVRVVMYEEPALRTQFGTEFDTYAARVPRWIPRPPG